MPAGRSVNREYKGASTDKIAKLDISAPSPIIFPHCQIHTGLGSDPRSLNDFKDTFFFFFALRGENNILQKVAGLETASLHKSLLILTALCQKQVHKP